MKPTIKVSIGGQAFSLDEDAYNILNNYLQVLKKHFETNPEADEIIADIEDRLSELLQIRLNNTKGAVSIEDAQDIINIMGNPKDFGDAEENDNADSDSESQKKNEHTGSNNSQEPFKNFKKRLYRDADNRVLGGVCSGLGHYFRIDPVAIRIIFVAIALLPNFVFERSGIFVVIAYLILWIVMPKARTFTQKLAMTGADPSIENIDDRTQSSSKKYRGSFLSDVLRVIFNIVAGTIAIITGLILIFMIGTLIWLCLDTEIVNASGYLSLFGLNTLYFKAAAFIVLILPGVGLFSLMVMILSRSRFKTRNLVSFLIGLTLWIVAMCYLGNKGVIFANAHKHEAVVTENMTINTNSDTLYVRLSDEYTNVISQPDVSALLYKNQNRKDLKISVLPEVIVREDSSLTDFKVEIKKHNFGKNQFLAERKAKEMKLNHLITDSLITISPQWYSNDNPFDMEKFEIIITAPTNKKIIIDEPLNQYYQYYYSKPLGITFYDNRSFYNRGHIFD